ncbi:MAG: DUF6261 family protein [Prevotellaceae bacterium]|nr:DUF6261 family protein [Prevotellaceae bacterium]
MQVQDFRQNIFWRNSQPKISGQTGPWRNSQPEMSGQTVSQEKQSAVTLATANSQEKQSAVTLATASSQEKQSAVTLATAVSQENQSAVTLATASSQEKQSAQTLATASSQENQPVKTSGIGENIFYPSVIHSKKLYTMEIKSISTRLLNLALHLQFVNDTKSLITKFPFLSSKIAPQYAAFCASIEKEDLCYKVIRKSDLSESKESADHARDAVITGLNEAVRTAIRHFDPAVSEAAKRLKIVLDTYNTPKSIALLSYDAETVAVANLLQEFEGKYAADVQTAGLTAWVTELHGRNDAFDRLTKAYNEQQAAKPPFKMKDVRNETDKAYRNIVFVINALIVMEGETEYTPFVTELNELIKHYAGLIAQHAGRNKAKKSSES